MDIRKIVIESYKLKNDKCQCSFCRAVGPAYSFHFHEETRFFAEDLEEVNFMVVVCKDCTNKMKEAIDRVEQHGKNK